MEDACFTGIKRPVLSSCCSWGGADGEFTQCCGCKPSRASAAPQNSQFGSYADFCAGILVILSSVSQVLELELKGRSTAAALGVEGGADFTDYLHLFRYSNSFFDLPFLIEWVILVGRLSEKSL